MLSFVFTIDEWLCENKILVKYCKEFLPKVTFIVISIKVSKNVRDINLTSKFHIYPQFLLHVVIFFLPITFSPK